MNLELDVNYVDFGYFLLGVLLGVAITSCFAFPRVGRVVARVFGIVLLTAGAGLLGWGIYVVARQETLVPMIAGPIQLLTVGQILGWGTGCLVGGIVTLSISGKRS